VRRNIHLLLTVAAVIGLVFGLGLLVAPGPLLRLYGLTTDATGLLLARLLGVEFIGYNLAAWVTRAADPSPAESAPRALVRAHLVSETLGALVSASAAARGLGNPLFWSVPALYGILAVAFLWATLALRRERHVRAE
jgi:hypothetical protein